MMQWRALFQKEMTELWRNKKWVWVPLVFILLTIMDPLSTYYMPQILDSVGGLPDGTVITLPDFIPPEIVSMSLGQLSSLGILIVALVSMGTIAGERNSGIAELILVKPVSYVNYITSKWAAYLALFWTSLFIGMAASWYYINLLFGPLLFTELLWTVLFYGLWVTLVASLSILYGAIFRTPGLVGFMTILTVIVMSILTSIFGHVLEWSPNNLSGYILEMLVTGSIPGDLIGTAAVTFVLNILLVSVAVFIFKSKEPIG